MEQIVELRRLRASLTEPDDRARLARVIRSLHAGLPPGIPKHRAARLLDVSPQGLDRWVRASAVPVVRRPGSSRALIDTTALLLLLAEARVLAENGEARPVGRAIERLHRDGRLRRRPRPNMSGAELRREYERSTPAQRLRDGIALSEFGLAVAAKGQEIRSRGG